MELTPTIADHNGILSVFEVEACTECREERVAWDYKPADWDRPRKVCREHSWDNAFVDDTDVAVQYITDTFDICSLLYAATLCHREEALSPMDHPQMCGNLA